MKKISTILLFVFITSFTSLAQNTSKNSVEFQKEYTQLENSVQVKLDQMQSDYDKETAVVTKNYQQEIGELTKEYQGNLIKNTLLQEKYQKKSQKITSKYDLQTKDLIYKYTLIKAKIENDFHHDKDKLMKKYDIYMN